MQVISFYESFRSLKTYNHTYKIVFVIRPIEWNHTYVVGSWFL